MKISFCATLFLLFQFSLLFSQKDSPSKGEIKGPFLWESEIYPGTERNYWIYVPKQYNASKPACVMVVQDGLSRAEGWRLPIVLDSLIAIKEIPVMVGIFIDHGIVPATHKEKYPRYNRSFEYDARGDRYARFLLEEILPEVSKTYNLSTDPNDRSIAGASSGAIAAFNVAWERPDKFTRVLSTIGSYVGLRGGEEFPKLIRITEQKPLRIFLEDGSNDLDIYAGGWWTANQSMLSALSWAGYEVHNLWGEGGHNSEHAVEILPEALVWLWKNYPQEVKSHPEKTKRRMNLTVVGENWKEILLNGIEPKQLAANGAGEVYFTSENAVYKINDHDGKPTVFVESGNTVGGLSFYKDGRLYLGDLDQDKIVAIDKSGVTEVVVDKVHADFITISDKGIYFSETTQNRIGFYSFDNKNVVYSPLPGAPSGLAISAEQTFLNVATSDGLFGYSFNIKADGSLDFGQEYIHYHTPYGSPVPMTKGLTIDSENSLYSATSLGIQVSDQLGRINFIFSQPAGNAEDVKLGGGDFDTLYLISDGRIFIRKINAKGILSWQPAITPPEPGL